MLAVAMLSACASYGGRNLQAGEAGLEDVLREMGQPAMRWKDADGSLQLAYPKGPSGFETYLARIGPDGKLQSIRNVLEAGSFARILPGMTKEQVLRILGPSEPSMTFYFKARDELVWDWRFQNVGMVAAHFLVLFDASAGTVRSSMIEIENFSAARGHAGHGR